MEQAFIPTIQCIETRASESGETYCRYKIGPIHPKHALTIGQGIRTSLLNEMTGFAVIAVEIKGAKHEFQLLPGIQESTIEILLNCSNLLFAGDISTNRPLIGYITASGPGEITAQKLRLPPHLRCINSHLKIATLCENGILQIRVLISSGVGFQSQDNFGLKTNRYHMFPQLLPSHLRPPVLPVQRVKGAATRIMDQVNNKIPSRTDLIDSKVLENKLDPTLEKSLSLSTLSEISSQDEETGLADPNSYKNSVFISGMEDGLPLPKLSFQENKGRTEAEFLYEPKNLKKNITRTLQPRWQKSHLLSVNGSFSPIRAVSIGWQEEIRLGQEYTFLNCQICTNGTVHPITAIGVGTANFLQLIASMVWINWSTLPPLQQVGRSYVIPSSHKDENLLLPITNRRYISESKILKKQSFFKERIFIHSRESSFFNVNRKSLNKSLIFDNNLRKTISGLTKLRKSEAKSVTKHQTQNNLFYKQTNRANNSLFQLRKKLLKKADICGWYNKNEKLMFQQKINTKKATQFYEDFQKNSQKLNTL